MNPAKVNKTLKKHVLIDENAIVVDLEKSQGSWIVDAATGKKYLDCFSQFASQPLGWNHPKMLAQKDRLLDVAIHKVANSDMHTTQYAEFVETFSKFTPDFKYHFYISGGALAVENALKTAFDWKMKKSGLPKGGTENLKVIHLKEAFHGRSGYTLSLTNSSKSDLLNPKTKFFPKFNWPRVTNPKIYHPVDSVKASNLESVSIKEIESYAYHPTSVAIIVEPIQGEGGDNHFRKEYFQELRRIADENDLLLIFDEVQTGVGLTGKMWAYEHFGVTPDIMCFGKKMQVCGICATDRLDEVKDNVFKVPSRINSTWGGNLVDMVRATMFLEIIEEDNLIENANDVGAYFLNKLIDKGYPNARGKGLMIAFDLNTTKDRDMFVHKASKQMLVLPCGEKSVRFRPHLTFTKEDVDYAMEVIKRSWPS